MKVQKHSWDGDGKNVWFLFPAVATRNEKILWFHDIRMRINKKKKNIFSLFTIESTGRGIALFLVTQSVCMLAWQSDDDKCEQIQCYRWWWEREMWNNVDFIFNIQSVACARVYELWCARRRDIPQNEWIRNGNNYSMLLLFYSWIKYTSGQIVIRQCLFSARHAYISMLQCRCARTHVRMSSIESPIGAAKSERKRFFRSAFLFCSLFVAVAPNNVHHNSLIIAEWIGAYSVCDKK